MIRRHPRLLPLAVGAGVAAIGAAGPARATTPPEPDVGIWNQVMLDVNMDAKAKGLRLALDFHLRRMNSPLQYVKDMSGAIVETRQNPNTFVVVRPAIGYMWAKWGGFFLGYIWLPDFFDDPVFARTRNVDEHRIYTQLTLRWAVEGRFDISWRNRVEHRIRTHGIGSDDIVDGVPQTMGMSRWAHRFRQQLRVAVNLKKGAPWQLLLYDEFFFHLTRTAYTEPGFDQNRVTLVSNELVADEPLVFGQNGLTMLEDGSLIGSRESAEGTQIFHVPDPPTTENTPAQATLLGVVPNDGQDQPIRVEALYTDCDGRVYLMDTGEDVGNNEGNRLLRFTGAYLQGDLAFEVITDLGNASVADIDDMSPGIVDGEVSDSLGFAMDSSALWQLDYTTGTGMQLADTDGTWGIHALGGPLFDDLQPRLYILSSGNDETGAELMQVDLDDFSNSRPLVTGPDFDLNGGYNGWSGLAGPLTECMTTIPG